MPQKRGGKNLSPLHTIGSQPVRFKTLKKTKDTEIKEVEKNCVDLGPLYTLLTRIIYIYIIYIPDTTEMCHMYEYPHTSACLLEEQNLSNFFFF